MDPVEVDGELGEGRTVTNLTVAIRGTDEEDGVEGSSTGRPGLCGSSERSMAIRRSFWTQAEDEEGSVAMRMVDGGDMLLSVSTETRGGGARAREK